MGFPKYVYKSGTGKKVDDNGLHTAESALVETPEALKALGDGWVESPVEATTVAEKADDKKPAAKKEK